MAFLFSLSVHVIGIVFWFGGLFAVAAYLKEERSTFHAPFARRLWTMFVFPGFLLALASGVAQIAMRGMPYYLKQGWFHGKLMVIVVALVASFFALRLIRKREQGEELGKRAIALLHAATGAALLIAVVLAEMKPF